MTKRLAGYDLNGWRDLCARSWLARPGEETVEDSEVLVSGGELGQVVRTGQNQRHPFVGGIQAGLSAHGKGDGWGRTIGEAERHTIRDLMAEPFGYDTALSAAFRALAPDPQLAVLAIPDCRETTERHQESWLSAMRLSGVRQPFLVWRPVLAALGVLETNRFADKNRLGIVAQHGSGFTTQVLTLRDTGKLTPERRRSGILHPSRQALSRRFDGALSQLRDNVPNGARERLDLALQPGRVALGEADAPEVFRLRNGDWRILDSFEMPFEVELDLLRSLSQQLSDCDAVLFDARMGQQLSTQFAHELEQELGRSVIRLAHDTIARGALEAARRLSNGEAAFFDFLPQVSTLVQGASGAINHNLVPEGEVLPAGKLYHSRAPARFHLMPGQDVISVYLNKETELAPRLARLEGITKVEKATEVQLALEQQPAAGRARLTLSSAALPTPHVIDFDAAEMQEETWDEIIARHEKPRPTIPERMILPNGMAVWDGYSNRGGLSDLLAREAGRPAPDWRALAAQLSSRPDQRYAVSSEGELPEKLPLGEEATLDQMIDRAKSEVLTRLADNTYDGNDALRFLTWAFRRCPQDVIPFMLSALNDSTHPFRARGRLTLVLQGLGRTVRRAEDMRPVMDHLLALPRERWKKDQTACMAFLVSRTNEALPLLERGDVEVLAEVVRHGLQRECGGGYTATFIYLPILLVGLLRWRMVEPFALVAGQDKAADRMAEPLDAIIQDLSQRARQDPHLKRYLELLRRSREALAGEGGHGHLLADLFGLAGAN